MSERDYTQKMLSYAEQICKYLTVVLAALIFYIVYAFPNLSQVELAAAAVLSVICAAGLVLSVYALRKHLGRLRRL